MKLFDKLSGLLRRFARRRPIEREPIDLADIPETISFHRREAEETKPTFSTDADGLSEPAYPLASTVSEFCELLQRLYDEEQGRTDPWIKLGIDFGTCNSKVVWRAKTDAFPVCFGREENRIQSYFMPTALQLQDGRVVAGDEAINSQFGIANFKMCLACSSYDKSACNFGNCSLGAGWARELFNEALEGEEIAFTNAVFLADLIAKAQLNVLGILKRTFRQEPRPKWTANLGVPERFIEQSPVAEKFNLILRTAWYMANLLRQYPGFRNVEPLANCYLAAREKAVESLAVLDDVTFGCSVYPEVGAEVASIVMNKTSETGLYAFVDVGAGTVDASLFNYFRDGATPNRPPFATDISKDLGAAHIESLATRASERSKLDFTRDELRRIKESYKQMSREERDAVKPQFYLLKRSAEYIGGRAKAFLINNIFRNARDNKFPGIVNEKIRLVLGGGGAALSTYQKAASEAFTSKNDGRRPEMTVLNKPVDFQMGPLPSGEFHRFAVAYGLSFSLEDLPDHILCRDVEMISRPKQRDWSFNPLYD